MSSRRSNSPPSSLCRFAFADGRHCCMTAHPRFNGLCFHHGTFSPRASRQDNFRREAASLANGTYSEADFQHTVDALVRGFAEGRISLGSFSLLTRVTSLINQTHVHALKESFSKGRGRAWEKIRELIDEEDGSRSAPRKKP